MIVDSLRSFLKRTMPRTVLVRNARRMRLAFRQQFELRQQQSRRALYGHHAPVVLEGSFKGMVYLDEIVWGPIEPKWIGTYEGELQPVVSKILQTAYRVVVDVGCAEGYYAVGLARAMKNSRVIAFDIDPEARRQVGKMSALNGCSNLVVKAECNTKGLNKLLGDQPALVIMDAEGAEYSLLNPGACPRLRNTDILVEIHKAEGISIDRGTQTLSERFEPTHKITTIPMAQRDAEAIASRLGLETVGIDTVRVMVDERRDIGQVWLWMQCKTSC